eukprot:PITA_31910
MLCDYWDDAMVDKVIELLHKYQDLFPTNITKLKGIVGHLGMVKITLKPNAKLVKQRPYHLNPKYKEKVYVELDKMLVAGIIESVEESDWLHAMLGHTRYYRKFIKCYAQITMPMEKLLKKDLTFYWNDDCMKSMDVLKGKLAFAPILVFPKWDVEFHVHVDASCITLGEVLTQEG